MHRDDDDAPSARGSGSGPSPAVRELVVECLERAEAGEDREHVLDELCKLHPEHSELLRRRLSLLGHVGILEDTAQQAVPERLGEFRLLQQIGGGGMGVVYLAVQESLGREVALKIVHPAQLYFRGARERFRREVETVASLQHPGIVPVHAVGDEDGVPYFAMEHVHGCSIEQVLADLAGSDVAGLTGQDLAAAIVRCTEDVDSGTAPGYVFAGSWEQACLHLVRQVADALHHAHLQGVVHRDVKPSNVMLTPDGRALLLDFGLASREDTGSSLTRPGSPIGSLPYMSPEQTRGDLAALDARTDVYGLGVTLYELLTLRPAYGGGAATAVVAAIHEGRPPRPRDLAPSTSWEAETLCLTAMDPDPDRRYASAADLARDAANVLEDRPIDARRAGVGLRVRRWVRRRPATSVALLLGALLVVGGPTVFAVQQHRHGQRLAGEQAATLAALQRALGAVDVLTHLGAEEVGSAADIDALRQRLLEEARALVEGLQDEVGEHPELAQRVAGLHHGIAEMHYALGRPSDALAATDTELQLRAAHEATAPVATSRAHRLRGMALHALGRVPDAAAAYRRAIAELEGPAARGELGDEHLVELVLALIDLSRTIHLEDPIEADATCGRALEHLDGLGLDGLETRAIRAQALNVLALIRRVTAGPAVAEPHMREAVELLEGLTNIPDALPSHGGLLGSSLYNLGLYAKQQGRVDEALATCRRALAVFDTLVIEYPTSPDYRRSQARAQAEVGNLLVALGRFDEAEVQHDAAQAGFRELIAATPDLVDARIQLATLLVNRCPILLYRGASAERIHETAGEAVRLLEQARDPVPGEANHDYLLGVALCYLAYGEQAAGEVVAARALFDRAAEHGGRAVERQPRQRNYRFALADTLWMMRETLEQQGDHARAAQTAGTMAEMVPDVSPVALRAATLLTWSASTVGGDDDLDPSAREELTARYQERAIGQLRRALELDHPVEEVRGDQDFAPLHELPAWQALFDGP